MENPKSKKKRNEEIRAKLKNMSKEAIQAAISKKKECNARALGIVEQLIEPNVEEFWLLENLKHINQCHFQDIVEERAITMCCGYPLCDKELSNVPKKMYKISTKENKVYDISDRKHFCSNMCYKASVFLKNQLYTSPLWLRDCENPVDYKILSSKQSSSSGSGSEVDLGSTSPLKFSSDFCECHSEGEAQVAECNDEKSEFLKHKCPLNHHLSNEKLPLDHEDVTNIVKGVQVEFQKEGDEIERKDKKEGNEIERKDKKEENKHSISKKPSDERKMGKCCETRYMKSGTKNVVRSEDIVLEIERKVKSWFTLDTLMFLLGEKGVKELLKLNGTSLEEMDSLRNKDTHMYEKYQEIYRKLNILELKDKQSEEDTQLPNKPLPDYEQLQEEAIELELKVRSFYKGEGKVSFAEEVCTDGDKIPDDQYPLIPLLDHHDVILTRRKILLEKLNRILPDIQNALELSQFRLSFELQQLVATFSLGPSNICLQASQWSLVCLIIIKLLTIRNEILNYAYTKELTQKRLTTFLLTYDLDGGYIDRLVSYFLDVEQIGTVPAF